MIVECSSENGVRLLEPFDFLRFKLVLKGVTASELRSHSGLTFIDDDNATISIEMVRMLSGRADDVVWEKSFQEMVVKARAHGWIVDESNCIRAHVERQT